MSSNFSQCKDWLANGADDKELERVSSVLDGVIEADAAEGASGNYAAQLVKATPRFAEFQELVGAWI